MPRTTIDLDQHFDGYKLGYSVGENNARNLRNAGSQGPAWWVQQFGIAHKDKADGFYQGYHDGYEENSDLDNLDNHTP